MIEGLLNLSGLLAGLASLYLAGNGLFVILSPGPRSFSFLENLAYSFGLGALGITLWMLVLSALSLPFSVPLIFYPWFSLAVLALLFKDYIRKHRQPFSNAIENRKPKTETRFHAWDLLFLALLAVLFIYAVLRAALYPVWAWDAYATWGFKAKVFYVNRSIHLQGFEAHNYYPNLVPLLLTYLYIWLGQVNDHLVKLGFPLLGAAILALLYSFFLRMGLSRTRSLGLTAFFALNGVTFIVHLYIAYADLTDLLYVRGGGPHVSLANGPRPPGRPSLKRGHVCGHGLGQVRRTAVSRHPRAGHLAHPSMVETMASPAGLALALPGDNPGLSPLAAFHVAQPHRDRQRPYFGLLRRPALAGPAGITQRSLLPQILRPVVACGAAEPVDVTKETIPPRHTR